MATSTSHNKHHFPIQQNPITPSKSYTHFLCKPLIVVVFLIVIPLFPSQAPEFINFTLLTKFWELLHLLFVGIAVCYGLFSRRKDVEINVETHSNIDNSQSYASRMFHVSSIFEDEFENFSGPDEKRMIETWNSQYFRDESVGVVANGSSVFNERSEPRSLISEDGFEIPSGFDEKIVSQAWNSEYFQGESMVVVGNGSYVLDEWGNAGPSIGEKPLGLPIRSLRSRIIDTDTTESINGSRSDSGLKGSSRSYDKMKNRKFGDLGPLNLEDKFKKSVVSPSPIPWRSRSGRMEVREEAGTVSHSSHSMPLSAEDYQFEPLMSRSSSSTRSFSSRTSSMSSSPHKLSPSSSISSELRNSKIEDLGRKKSSVSPSSSISSELPNSKIDLGRKKSSVSPSSSISLELPNSKIEDLGRKKSSVSPSSSISSELPNPKIEDLGKKKSSCGSSSVIMPSPSTLINGKAPLSRPNSRRFSIGSSSEINVKSNFENELKDFSTKGREDPSGSKELGLGSLKADMKPATLVKASLRGKSVRTIRANEQTGEARKVGEICRSRIDDKVGQTFNEVETALMEKTGTRTGGLRNLSVDIKKQNLHKPCTIPNPTISKNQKGEEQEFCEKSFVQSEDDSESEDDNFQVSSDEEESNSNTVNDAGTDTSEVDKKAGEFIAKFREQIRLQKIESMKGSGRLWATHW